ncbi:hypothetical protein Tco_1421014 [Tanacetum coccineum]
MATNEETNVAGTDTRPPMLVENDYESWKIRIHRLYTHSTCIMKASCQKTLQEQEQSESSVDPMEYVAHPTLAPALHHPQLYVTHTYARTSHDALMATRGLRLLSY